MNFTGAIGASLRHRMRRRPAAVNIQGVKSVWGSEGMKSKNMEAT
jgi:hypothetical protein